MIDMAVVVVGPVEASGECEGLGDAVVGAADGIDIKLSTADRIDNKLSI